MCFNVSLDIEPKIYLRGVKSYICSNKVALATDLPYSLGVEVLLFLLDLICIISPHEAEPFGCLAKLLVDFALQSLDAEP